MKLAKLQQDFLEALNNPAKHQGIIENYIVGDDFPAVNRLKIYKDSMTAALQNTLKAIYPVCARLVGDDFFSGMASIYVNDYPSYSPDLNDYGKDFSEFIATFRPAKDLDYLTDVAHLEWAWHLAFHGPDADCLDYNALAEVDIAAGQDVRFNLVGNSDLIDSKYPIHKIWEVNQPDYLDEPVVNLAEGGVYVIVWRRNLDTLIEVVSDVQYQLLQLIQRGILLSELCEYSVENGIDIQLELAGLTQRGWLAEFEKVE